MIKFSIYLLENRFSFAKINGILALQILSMISPQQFQVELNLCIQNALREDIGPGDYSSLACIPGSAVGTAKLLVKEAGIIAGVAYAKQIFEHVVRRRGALLNWPLKACRRGISADSQEETPPANNYFLEDDQSSSHLSSTLRFSP